MKWYEMIACETLFKTFHVQSPAFLALQHSGFHRCTTLGLWATRQRMRSSLLSCTRLFRAAALTNSLAHWIGLRENLQETMVFTIKLGLSCRFSHHPIQWLANWGSTRIALHAMWSWKSLTRMDSWMGSNGRNGIYGMSAAMAASIFHAKSMFACHFATSSLWYLYLRFKLLQFVGSTCITQIAHCAWHQLDNNLKLLLQK